MKPSIIKNQNKYKAVFCNNEENTVDTRLFFNISYFKVCEFHFTRSEACVEMAESEQITSGSSQPAFCFGLLFLSMLKHINHAARRLNHTM